MVEIIVNGRKEMRPVAEAVASLQMDGSAAYRLQQAALTEKRLKEDREKFEAERAALGMPLVPSAEGDRSDEDVTALRDAILDGDEETLDATLRAERERNRATPVDVNKVADLAAARAAERIELRDAVKAFETTHADLANDPWARDLVDKETEALQVSDPDLSFSEILDKAAANVSSRIEALASRTGKGNDLDLEERTVQKRKAAKTNVPTAPAAKVSLGVDAPPAPSNSDVILEMKKARGQA